VRYGMTALSLLSENGRVAGVLARDPAGREHEIHAGAGVVMATGGYQGSASSRGPARVGLPRDAPFLGVPTCVGDGHRMTEQAGGDLVNMSFVPRIVMLASALAEDVIAVTPAGERFHDETGPSEYRVRAVEEVGAPVHYLFDEAARRRYADLVDQFPDPLVSAEDLPTLAHRIDSDSSAMVSAVAEWNSAVESGASVDRFGRVIFPPTRQGIRQPPFHAARCRIGAAFTVGGARIDAAGRVLDRAARAPIPGLWAVGDCAGSLNAAAGTGGVHITSALAFGQAAAEAAIASTAP
jgi:succinate dehydrogenase/fumarate reductase flavoprotein subunit